MKDFTQFNISNNRLNLCPNKSQICSKCSKVTILLDTIKEEDIAAVWISKAWSGTFLFGHGLFPINNFINKSRPAEFIFIQQTFGQCYTIHKHYSVFENATLLHFVDLKQTRVGVKYCKRNEGLKVKFQKNIPFKKNLV